MLKIDKIEKLLFDFFKEDQIKEIKKNFAGIDSKKLTSYLKDSGKPVETYENEGFKSKLQIDFLITYANAVLSKSQLIEFLLNGAELLKSFGEFEIAIGIFDEILQKASTDPKLINLRSNCILAKADIFQRQAKWDESLFYLKKARKEFEINNDIKGTAKCENLLGTIYGERGNIKKAKAHFEKSLSLLSSSKDKNLTGMLEINLGIINDIQGNYDDSYSFLHRALIKFEQLQDQKRIAEIRHNLGMLFMHKGEYDSAVTEFDKSISVSLKPGFLSILGLAYLSKSYVYTQLNDFFLASAFIDKAMEVCYALNDRLSMADIYKIKGIIERNLRNFKLSENYLLTSIRINQELFNKLNEAESLYELGILYTEMDIKEKAKQCFGDSSKYFNSINSHTMVTKLQNHILQLS